jgi:guanylate kinase
VAARLTPPFPIVISGPSGAGKTTIVDEILRMDPLLRRSISVTTRPPRSGEVDGEAYFFVSEAEFEKRKRGQLIEWARVHDALYGTPRDLIERTLRDGHDIVLNIDVQGGASVKKAFPESVLIFILTPTRQVLEERIRNRAKDLSEDIHRRLENAWGEIKRATTYEYILENAKLDETVATVLAIVRSERHRRGRYGKDYIDRFNPKA